MFPQRLVAGQRVAHEALELTSVRREYRVGPELSPPVGHVRQGDEAVGVDDQATVAGASSQQLGHKGRDWRRASEPRSDEHGIVRVQVSLESLRSLGAVGGSD